MQESFCVDPPKQLQVKVLVQQKIVLVMAMLPCMHAGIHAATNYRGY
jgi:hypothetical protein